MINIKDYIYKSTLGDEIRNKQLNKYGNFTKTETSPLISFEIKVY